MGSNCKTWIAQQWFAMEPKLPTITSNDGPWLNYQPLLGHQFQPLIDHQKATKWQIHGYIATKRVLEHSVILNITDSQASDHSSTCWRRTHQPGQVRPSAIAISYGQRSSGSNFLPFFLGKADIAMVSPTMTIFNYWSTSCKLEMFVG